MKRIVTASNFGKTEDFTKEVVHKTLKMKTFEQAEMGEKHSHTQDQHQERQKDVNRYNVFGVVQ